MSKIREGDLEYFHFTDEQLEIIVWSVDQQVSSARAGVEESTNLTQEQLDQLIEFAETGDAIIKLLTGGKNGTE